MGLREYRRKRDFSRTPEPVGEEKPGDSGGMYVIHKHAASHLHYDLRLELEGVLKSWAVPKGPSMDPDEKRLAVHVEDHPLEYGAFEGVIPEGEYGGGTVMIWDRGSWAPEGDASAKYRKGHLTFRLVGKKLRGSWNLARMGGSAGEGGKYWLLIKKRDEEARPQAEYDVLEEMSLSASTGRSMEEIASSRDRVWSGTVGELTGDGGPAREPEPDPGNIRGARPARMPARTRPELATLVNEPPPGDRWLHEIKYDGYRLLCFKDGEKVHLVSRNGKDWTANFPGVARAAASLQPQKAVLDGEIVVLRPDGTTDFQALQNALEGAPSGRMAYYAFDILFYEGYDLTGAPLLERKECLKKILRKEGSSTLLFGDHIRGMGSTVFDQACRLGMEGIVSKLADSRYEQRRSRNWVKAKCLKRQEFVIGGYSEPSGSRTAFGALLLGYYDGKDRLVYAGRVGTGFNETSLRRIMTALSRLEQKQSPFQSPPTGRDARGVHWVKPRLVAEIEFTEWTQEGILRHPSFKGLREDKNPEAVRREEPERASETVPAAARAKPVLQRNPTVAGVPITNPERILYPEQGLTKRALTEYYEKAGDRILPHIRDRPLTLVRCPQGHQKKCFYQKHLTEQTPKALREIPVREKEESQMYVSAVDLKGLISLVQLGVLEFHPWGSRADRLEQPDRLIFDLDPGEGIEHEQLADAARLLRGILEELGIRGFLKTTGGKGYHVVAPVVRGPGWEELREFAENIARMAVRMRPDLLVSTMLKSRRGGKIFVDYLRNARGATAVAPYSTRARAQAPVAVPMSWDELDSGLSPDKYNILNISERLALPDPWAEFFRVRQYIGKKVRSAKSEGGSRRKNVGRRT